MSFSSAAAAVKLTATGIQGSGAIARAVAVKEDCAAGDTIASKGTRAGAISSCTHVRRVRKAINHTGTHTAHAADVEHCAAQRDGVAIAAEAAGAVAVADATHIVDFATIGHTLAICNVAT